MMTLNKMIVGGFIGVALTSLQAWAIPLNVGSSILMVAEADPVGAHLISTKSETFSAYSGATLKFSGTLISSVYNNDSANSLGGLTFTYKIIRDNTGTATSLTGFSLNGWDSFASDVSYQTPPTGKIPASVDRLDSDVINFALSGFTKGSSSVLIVVQSNADRYQDLAAGLLGGVTVNVGSFSPAVPDGGTTMILFGIGLTGLGIFRRRRA